MAAFYIRTMEEEKPIKETPVEETSPGEETEDEPKVE